MHTGIEPPRYAPAPARSLAPGPSTWFLLAACFLLWPIVFATVIAATLFMAVGILDQGIGSPIGWLISWFGSGMAYSLVVGAPLAVFALQRRWYLRLIPALILVVPVGWVISMLGVWALPGAAVIALSIALEATGVRDRATLRVWTRMTASRRR